MIKKYALGLDFGTNSVRSLIVDITDGTELSDYVSSYTSGLDGILLDERDPNVARQNPADYLSGMKESVRGAIANAREKEGGFDPMNIIGIGIDTTGSSPMPVDFKGVPLAVDPDFSDNLNAMVWLWKDHSSHAEAARITAQASRIRPQYLAKSGGTYSSEWFWSKILHCRNVDSRVFEAAHSFVEICDWLPAVLTGETRPEKIHRSVCAAGHKAMYSAQWGGLPDKEFLAALDPSLADLRDHLYDIAVFSDRPAGYLTDGWAETLGMKPGTAVAVGAFDAHMGGVGAGIREGVLVKILGTSTCDIMVFSREMELADIPGVCGIVDGSVLPDFIGIEAGQSAVGDIFLWFVNNLVPEKYGLTVYDKFKNLEVEAAKQKPGEHGLIALDWNNGNRNILVDVRLSGLLIGQTLHTQPHEIYRALIEATAFGALTIVKRIEEFGVEVREIVNCGGLASKNEFLMKIYADILQRPMKVSRSDQTPALGAAIFGAVAAGREISGYGSVEEARDAMTGIKQVYAPDGSHAAVYTEMYRLYRQLHDAFGTESWTDSMYNVMKDLISLREQQRGAS